MLDKLKELKLKYQILLLKSNTMMQKLQKKWKSPITVLVEAIGYDAKITKIGNKRPDKKSSN